VIVFPITVRVNAKEFSSGSPLPVRNSEPAQQNSILCAHSCDTCGKSMKAVELAVFKKDGWRITLSEPFLRGE
jgi:hypothetical protein